MARVPVENSESTIEVAVPVVAPIVEAKVEAPVIDFNCSVLSAVDHPVSFVYGGQNIRVSPRAKISNLLKNLLPETLPKGLRVIG